jgi:hypothetical protein
MPAKVEDTAIDGGPEPAFWILALALCAIAYFYRRRFA